MVSEQQAFNFEDGPPKAQPAASPLARRLVELAGRGIYLGTSSWKYPGWLGTVYDPTRYSYRNKFSKKKFEQNCLAEYAHTFPTVCGDFAFYQFPSAATWKRNFEQLPAGYPFSLKVPEEITIETYPNLPRYGQRAGKSNGHFMDAELLRDQLLRPLEIYKDQLGVLIFQFGTIHMGPMTESVNFVARMDDMLSALPTDEYRFAVEVRNPSFLEDRGYFDCLRRHRTAHCFNSWTRMPPIEEQMKRMEAFTADHVVARFLLKPGRTYQQAVEQFSPYERIQDPYPEGRNALRNLIEHCLQNMHKLFAFVNNRFEGNAVETIEGAVEE